MMFKYFPVLDLEDTGTCIAIVDAPATAERFLTKDEWEHLAARFQQKPPLKEVREMMVRPFKTYPGPHTCNWCKFCDLQSQKCTKGRTVTDIARTTCEQWRYL